MCGCVQSCDSDLIVVFFKVHSSMSIPAKLHSPENSHLSHIHNIKLWWHTKIGVHIHQGFHDFTRIELCMIHSQGDAITPPTAKCC